MSRSQFSSHTLMVFHHRAVVLQYLGRDASMVKRKWREQSPCLIRWVFVCLAPLLRLVMRSRDSLQDAHASRFSWDNGITPVSAKFENLGFDLIVVLVLDRFTVHHAMKVALAHKFIIVFAEILFDRLLR